MTPKKTLVLTMVLALLLFGALPLASNASTVYPYWAKGDEIILYQRQDEGNLRAIPAVEPFMVTGEQGEWFEVLVFASGGYRYEGKVKKQGVYPLQDLSQSLAVVTNPVSSDRLHLRVSASAGSASKGKYYNGTLAFVYEIRNGFAKVRVGEIDGYMDTRYLAFGEAGLALNHNLPILTVNNPGTTGLRLRNGPGSNYSNFGLMPNGSTVLALGLTPAWVHVQTLDKGLTYYMLLSGLSPRLQFDYQATSTIKPVVTNKPSTSNAWNGPAGYHGTAPWIIPIEDYTGAVNNPNPDDRLHLRTEPRTNAKSLGKYYNGVLVAIRGVSGGEWAKVAIGSLEGYMKTEFLVIGEVHGQTKPATAMPVMIVSNPNSARNLHLRAGQSIYSKSLGLYNNGTKVVLMGFSDEWAHVIVDGKMGFMLANFLK